MNRTKIEWTDYTWNPITGCSRRCSYCYAWKMAKRLRGRYGYPKDDPFRVTFHPDRLNEPSKVKKPSKIFVCSMGEMFDKDSKYGWIGLIFAVIKRNPHHIFQILTKCPEVLPQFSFPENVWLGITIDRQREVKGLKYLLETDAKVKFISFEPLHEEIDIILDGIDWIIIGSQTNPYKPPNYEWVLSLIQQAKSKNIPVFVKDNLKPIMFSIKLLQEFPCNNSATSTQQTEDRVPGAR